MYAWAFHPFGYERKESFVLAGSLGLPLLLGIAAAVLGRRARHPPAPQHDRIEPNRRVRQEFRIAEETPATMAGNRACITFDPGL